MKFEVNFGPATVPAFVALPVDKGLAVLRAAAEAERLHILAMQQAVGAAPPPAEEIVTAEAVGCAWQAAVHALRPGLEVDAAEAHCLMVEWLETVRDFTHRGSAPRT